MTRCYREVLPRIFVTKFSFEGTRHDHGGAHNTLRYFPHFSDRAACTSRPRGVRILSQSLERPALYGESVRLATIQLELRPQS